MTEIIDLGNGYGRIDGYTSSYASLTFLLNERSLGKLYVTGYISRDEYIQALIGAGYEPRAARWKAAVASVTTEQWKTGLERAGAI